ncbi:MAG: DUF4159 domain-containing protein [bacterium]
MKVPYLKTKYLVLSVLVSLSFDHNSWAQGINGDNFTFVRTKYTSGGPNFRLRNPFGARMPFWAVDYPSADENLMEILKKETALHIDEQAVALSLSDPDYFHYPFAYILEVGYMELTQTEADSLREWLLRGGFLMVDDFHGPYEWHHFVRQMKKVFPDRPIVDIPLEHPVFHCYYDFDELIQVPGLGSWLRGVTYEKGGVIPHCMGILDDQDRLMVLIMRNMDLGDAWEHATDVRYPPEYSVIAFKMGINFIIYALTH